MSCSRLWMMCPLPTSLECRCLISLQANVVTFFFFLLGTSYSPQENSHNHSALHSSNSHSSNPSNNPSKTSDAVSIFDWYLSLHQSPHSNRLFNSVLSKMGGGGCTLLALLNYPTSGFILKTLCVHKLRLLYVVKLF